MDKTEIRIPLSGRKHILVIVHHYCRGRRKNSLEGPFIVNSNDVRRNGDIRVNIDQSVIEELKHLAVRLAKTQVSLLPVVSEARRLLCIR